MAPVVPAALVVLRRGSTAFLRQQGRPPLPCVLLDDDPKLAQRKVCSFGDQVLVQRVAPAELVATSHEAFLAEAKSRGYTVEKLRQYLRPLGSNWP